MKKTVLSLTLLSATLFHAAGRAEGPKPAVPPVLNPAESALLRQYDLNHDGRLDEAELAAAHEAMLGGGSAGSPRGKLRAALVRRFDRNGDGRLDAVKQAEARKAILARFDTNQDGRLDENERAAMRSELRAGATALKLKN